MSAKILTFKPPPHAITRTIKASRVIQMPKSYTITVRRQKDEDTITMAISKEKMMSDDVHTHLLLKDVISIVELLLESISDPDLVVQALDMLDEMSDTVYGSLMSYDEEE